MVALLCGGCCVTRGTAAPVLRFGVAAKHHVQQQHGAQRQQSSSSVVVVGDVVVVLKYSSLAGACGVVRRPSQQQQQQQQQRGHTHKPSARARMARGMREHGRGAARAGPRGGRRGRFIAGTASLVQANTAEVAFGLLLQWAVAFLCH